ncbi:nucleotidyltransferase family protein [Arcobacter sp. YIC-80]|uniref:nucleotidyltransferase family protein n=1 Tax=Arcobacter sp. YIC-80 TaxID=3376683 RepID=UPI00385001D6
MNAQVLEKLKQLKPKLQNEGFELIGVFGSFARNEEKLDSDIDILYQIKDTNEYLKKYSGWDSILHIVETKELLKKELNRDVDFVDKSSLNHIANRYILKDLVYV